MRTSCRVAQEPSSPSDVVRSAHHHRHPAGTGDPQDWLLEIEQAGSSVISTHLANLWSCDCWIAEVVIRREASNLTVTMADGHPQFTNRDGQVLVEPRTGPDPPGDPPKVEAA